jgi:hypothetical protein
MSLKNKKAARPDGTQADGIDKEESINSVCEQNSATRDKCQGGPRSGKTAATIQILTENFNIARRAVHIAAVIMNADGLCRYDSVEKCRKVWPPDNKTCEKCIEKWLLAKARKELRNA